MNTTFFNLNSELETEFKRIRDYVRNNNRGFENLSYKSFEMLENDEIFHYLAREILDLEKVLIIRRYLPDEDHVALFEKKENDRLFGEIKENELVNPLVGDLRTYLSLKSVLSEFEYFDGKICK